MYKCRACGKKIELPDDHDTNTQMEAGGLVRLMCGCRLEGALDIVVGLDPGSIYGEDGELQDGYYVCSWNYSGSDPQGLFRNITV